MQIIRDEEIEKKVAQHKEQKNFNLTHLIGIVQWQKKTFNFDFIAYHDHH